MWEPPPPPPQWCRVVKRSPAPPPSPGATAAQTEPPTQTFFPPPAALRTHRTALGIAPPRQGPGLRGPVVRPSHIRVVHGPSHTTGLVDWDMTRLIWSGSVSRFLSRKPLASYSTSPA